MAPVYTTVIGQCMGARNIDAADFYFRKLNKITLVLSILWNALIFAITPLIVRYSAISPEAKKLVIWLGWGVIGVAIGMSIDLVFRGAIFIWRLKSRKWTQFQLI